MNSEDIAFIEEAKNGLSVREARVIRALRDNIDEFKCDITVWLRDGLIAGIETDFTTKF